jgi:hypothetical protein
MKLIIRLWVCYLIFGWSALGQETISLKQVTVEKIPTVQSLTDLTTVHETMVKQLIPIAPPSGDLFTQLNKEAFPFNFKSLPDALLKSMVAKMDDSAGVPIPVYSIFVGMDEKDVLFFVEGCEWAVYRLPLDYNPILFRNQALGVAELKELDRGNLDFLERIYNPYRFFTEIKLVPEIFYADYQEGLAIAETKALPMVRIVEPTEGSMNISFQAVSAPEDEETEVPMMAMDAFPPSPGGTVTNVSGGSGSSNQLMQLTFTPPTGFGNYAEIFRTTSLIPTNWSVVLNSQAVTSGVEATWIDYASSNQATGFYIISDATDDVDSDGFSNLRESYITHTSYTNFNFYDSDNDGLHDWFETIYFGSITNQTGTDDFDYDGLLNNQEWILTSNSMTWISDPTLYDTDGDGTDDFVEFTQGSNPSNPADAGQPPPATTLITFSILSHDNSTYTLSLVEGTNSYEVSSTGAQMNTISHEVPAGYSYQLSVSQSGSGTLGYKATLSGNGIIIADEDSVLGDHTADGTNWTPAKLSNTGTVSLINISLSLTNEMMSLKYDNQCLLTITANPSSLNIVTLIVELFNKETSSWSSIGTGTTNNWIAKKPVATVFFPSAQEMATDSIIENQRATDWQLASGVNGDHCERGGYIYLNTETSTYRIDPWPTGTFFGVTPNTTPCDSFDEYFVGEYHLHATLRNSNDITNATSYPTGPSPDDILGAYETGTPGLLRGRHANEIIETGHTDYFYGPTRRRTL